MGKSCPAAAEAATNMTTNGDWASGPSNFFKLHLLHDGHYGEPLELGAPPGYGWRSSWNAAAW